MPAGAGESTSGVCEIRTGANMLAVSKNIGRIQEPGTPAGSYGCKTWCKDVQAGANVQTTVPVNPADYIALPVAKDEPCHVCGRRPTSSVKRGGGGYLCYDCLKRAKRPAKVQPLPGVLDHRTFERTKIELGRCGLCAEKKAVYRSREAQANICEGCYTRLVREWNGREGVR